MHYCKAHLSAIWATCLWPASGQVFCKTDGSTALCALPQGPPFGVPCVVVNAETRKVYIADGVGVHSFTYEL